MLNVWLNQIENMFDPMVEWRRYIHQHPELSFQEVETPKMIASILESFGIEVRRNVGGRGVVGIIYGGKPGKTIALRADFDALPIQDEKDVPYKSKVNGVMHACGHDGHTATLLAVAKVLQDNRDQLEGNVVLLHQHAEEKCPGGAIAMIEDGCLEGVDVVFGTHLLTKVPTGFYGYRKGYTMAASDQFVIKIHGKGGHGASPHETVDAIAIGSQVVNQLQHIVSRQVNPLKSAVVSVGSFHAGKAPNVIADSAELSGTVRTFDEDVRDQIKREMEVIVNGICSAFHATYTITYESGYPAVYNHAEETEIFVQAVKKNIGEDTLIEIDPSMGGEDFAYYLKQKPGMFFYTGARNESIKANYPHHHPKFTFDEQAMVMAGKGLISIVHHYLVSEASKEEKKSDTEAEKSFI
ncbi:M20 family metallopeptidase [Psychrobacillus sp. OK032]|uniref:M20 metallopeptidase family protein n=1 Tax=Psychrobacillus sp. OK032 TaxID=1884358 RepID=UPI0008B1D68C|nr:M20 family metallopeptidase [Psychrobacillus sp. OK032]SER78001.1 amidohydrolase [Psychrobacillus sp. OK032]